MLLSSFQNGYSQASFGLSTVLPYPLPEQFQKPPQVNLNQGKSYIFYLPPP